MSRPQYRRLREREMDVGMPTTASTSRLQGKAMTNLRSLALTASLLLLFSNDAYAWCQAAHGFNGQIVQVRERNGPSQHWAHASWDPDGWPSITYGVGFYQLPPIMKEFTRFHECGHLSLRTTDEIAANCYALRARPWSHGELQYIADFHIRIGPLPPQYFGSGAGFWSATMQRC